MPRIILIKALKNTIRQISRYRDIEISARQVEAGKVKDARNSLDGIREKYGI